MSATLALSACEAAAKTGFTLIKHKRAGTGTYARTAAQLAAVGGADDWNILHWIDPALDESLIAGTNTLNLQGYFGNATAAVAAHSGRRRLFLPRLDFRINTMWTIGVANLTLDARGAKITSVMSTNDPFIYIPPQASKMNVFGLHTVSTGGNPPAHYSIYGADCRMIGVVMEDLPNADGQQLYVRADGFQMIQSRMQGNNAAVFIDGSNFVFEGNNFIGSDIYNGDDCIAVKAMSGLVAHGKIIGNYVYRYANIVALGSQIGVEGAYDPTYSRIARNIDIIGNIGVKCAYGLYIKPGGLIHDYRDGAVEAITYSNNHLYDPTGNSFERAIAITAGHGAKVRDVKGTNNTSYARAKGTSSTGAKCAMHIWASGTGEGTAPERIEDIDVGFTHIDPHDGAPFGTAGTTAYPIENIVEIQPHGATFRDINIMATANGCLNTGILVRKGVGDNVTINRARLRNINTSGGVNGKGIRVLNGSTVRLSGDVQIEMSSGDRFGTVGTGLIVPLDYIAPVSKMAAYTEPR